MNSPPVGPPRSEQAVDEAVAESFPASDSPAWSPIHPGMPARPAGPGEHHEKLQSQILMHLDRLGRRFDRDRRVEAREELVAQALLDAGCPVVREPLQGGAQSGIGVRNLEAEVPGVVQNVPSLVVGARYDADDVSRMAVFLAAARVLATGSPARRTVRFVAFADSPSLSGPLRYAGRLQAEEKRVHAMISIGTIALSSDKAAVVFAYGWRNWGLGSAAAKAFRRASGVRVHAFPFAWWPGLYASDYIALGRKGWPAMMVAELPSSARVKNEPNVARMATAAMGLVASVRALADRAA